MKLVPFEKFTIETRLTKEQVRERLQKKIGKNKVNNFERADPNYFYGALREDEFEIQPILHNERNAWTPFLFGKINESRLGTIVTVTMRPNLVILFNVVDLRKIGF